MTSPGGPDGTRPKATPRRRASRPEFSLGIVCGTFGAVAFTNLVVTFGSCVTFSVGPWIGLTQFVYIAPLCWYAWRRRAYDALAGVALGALITFLASARCGFGIIRGL